MRYCVTGGLGVIGSLFAKQRLAAGDGVEIIDDGQERRHELNRPPLDRSLVLVSHDRLGDLNSVSGIDASDTDRILHAAASTGIPYSGQAPLDDWSRNVDGTLEVLEAVRANPKPLVVLSSVKPLSTANLHAIEQADHYALSGYGLDETAALSPDEVYAASKAAQSMLCQAYARSYELPVVVFRCSNLCGNAAPHGMRHGWFTNFCIRAALGWTIEIQGSGKQTRDMLFTSDVHDAAMLAFAGLESGDIERGSIFNLGGGQRNLISVLQLVQMLRDMGAKFDTRQAPGRAHEDMLFCTDSSRFIRATGWERQVSVRETAARIYDWAKENRDALAEVYAAERF